MRFIQLYVCMMVFFVVSSCIPHFVFSYEGRGGGVVINEIMYNPAGKEVYGEWVEIYNSGNTNIDMTNWALTDNDGKGDDFIFPKFILPPHAYVLIYTGIGENDSDASDGVASFYIGASSSIWTNTGDDVLLKNDEGKGIDYLAYGNSTSIDPPPSEIIWEGNSLEAKENMTLSRFPNGYDTDSASDWKPTIPTPGRENIFTDEKPVIEYVRQKPSNPTPMDHVKITVKCTDDIGIKKAEIYYRISDDYMRSEGIELGKGLFNFTLGPFPDKTKVYYYITAYDTSDQTCIYPENATDVLHFIVSSEKPHVVINEVMPKPSTMYEDEWIEIYNPSEREINIGGWFLDDVEGGGSKPYEIPQFTYIDSKEFILFWKNRTKISLNNDWDIVRITDENGILIDEVEYNKSKNDESFGRIPDGGDWGVLPYPTPGESNGMPEMPNEYESKMMITEVYFYPYPNRDDEYVAIYNPNDVKLNISFWKIYDGESHVVLPPGTIMEPHKTIYITQNGTSFREEMGFYPDFECDNTDEKIPNVLNEGSWPSLRNTGDIIHLLDEWGNVIDTFLYGIEGEYPGWIGKPTPLIGQGEVYKRNRINDEFVDTNTSKDWKYLGIHTIGQSNFPIVKFEGKYDVKMFVSPDCSFEAIIEEIKNATDSINLCVYQLESWYLSQEIINACKRDVSVRILLEGGPVGGISNEEKYVVREIVKFGGKVFFMQTNASAGVHDRYAYIHSKYCVIDNEIVIVGSENWKKTGIPTNNTFGNRGWGIILKSKDVATYLNKVFNTDCNTTFRDIIPYTPEHPVYGDPPEDFEMDKRIPYGVYIPRFCYTHYSGYMRVTPIIGPEHTLLENDSIIEILRNAEKRIYVEQFSCGIDWHQGKKYMDNLYLNAIIDAARRGVEVKVILDSTYVDPDSPKIDNDDVVNYLNYIARKENLPLIAKLSNVPGVVKTHNKGFIVDSEKVFISSLNWGRNSVMENREVGLIIEHKEVAQYYETVFIYDWNQTLPWSGKVDDEKEMPEEPISHEVDQTLNYAIYALMIIVPILFVALLSYYIYRKKKEEDWEWIDEMEFEKMDVEAKMKIEKDTEDDKDDEKKIDKKNDGRIGEDNKI